MLEVDINKINIQGHGSGREFLEIYKFITLALSNLRLETWE
ncbi:10297_t:CDS:2 [Racocetra fulgida]|uniref:10297_t:CDS:1 n=1 Tax=Racocetra fulgida TaxID=60492 RepID=A0A9N8YUQ2_9GLOM|nr:10297_t:CDS:2 [Racocetra fulgida]